MIKQKRSLQLTTELYYTIKQANQILLYRINNQRVNNVF